jgi:hypothetical protein
MIMRKPLSLEEVMKDAPPRTSPPASLEARMAMVAAARKSSASQVQAAGRWLEKKTADEVLKRHSDIIEVAIGKAQASGDTRDGGGGGLR